MKKIFSLSLLMLGSISTLLAQQGRSVLSLSLSDNSPVTISVDGNNYDADANGIVTASDLDAGRHNVQVFRTLIRPGRKVPVLTTFTVRTNEERATLCTVDAGSGQVDIRLESAAPLDDRSREQTDRRNDDRREERMNDRDDQRVSRNDQRAADRDEADDDQRDHRRSDRDERMGGHRWREDRRDRDDRYENRNDRRNGHDNNREEADEQEPEMVVLTESDVISIKANVQRKSTDASKSTALQAEIGDRSFSTEQVRTLLRLMNNETYKMKFARWAIDGVTDIEDFGKLSTEFKLAANKREIKKLATEAAQQEP